MEDDGRHIVFQSSIRVYLMYIHPYVSTFLHTYVILFDSVLNFVRGRFQGSYYLCILTFCMRSNIYKYSGNIQESSHDHPYVTIHWLCNVKFFKREVIISYIIASWNFVWGLTWNPKHPNIIWLSTKDSCNLHRLLFYTCIWIDRVRKLFILSLILIFYAVKCRLFFFIHNNKTF